MILLQNSTTTEQIPKKIWTYWDTLELPPFIQKCIDTWRKLNPTYEIIVLNEENLSQYIGCYEAKAIRTWKFNQTPQRHADLIRLEVLELHGGIWLDASIILYEPIDWVQHNGSCVLYSTLERSIEPVVENWFIAATKGHPFIKFANKHFRAVAKFHSLPAYLATVEKDILRIIPNPTYLTVYISMFKAYRLYKDIITVYSNAHGPENFMTRGGLLSLCFSKQYFIKLTQGERQELQRNPKLERCVFD